MEKKPHLVIVFPQDSKDEKAVAELCTRVIGSLRSACSTPPILVRPNLSTVCCLCFADLKTLAHAVEDVIDPYAQWLVVPVGKPFEASGLANFANGLNRPSP